MESPEENLEELIERANSFAERLPILRATGIA